MYRSGLMQRGLRIRGFAQPSREDLKWPPSAPLDR